MADNKENISVNASDVKTVADPDASKMLFDDKMVLRTENLVKKYRQRTVVNHVSINVTQGEIVGLLGPNGAGKTTTFYMTVGLITPNEGQIYLNDLNITKYPVYKRAQNGIGYLAQEPSVFRKLSVENNIRSVLETDKYHQGVSARQTGKPYIGIPPAKSAQKPRRPIVGWRTPPYGNCAVPCHKPKVYNARRTVCRCRPYCRGGHTRGGI